MKPRPLLLIRAAPQAWTDWTIAVPDDWRRARPRSWRLALAGYMLRWAWGMALGRIQ